MDLDKAIEHFNFRMNMSVCVTREKSELNQGVRDLLVELKQLRRSQMQPAVKYLGNSMCQQFKHMESELLEIKQELEPFLTNEKNLAMEVIDLQMSCQTFLEGSMDLSKQEIADYVQMVVKKNADRKYDKVE